jgi:hypothetical protein
MDLLALGTAIAKDSIYRIQQTKNYHSIQINFNLACITPLNNNENEKNIPFNTSAFFAL